MHMTTLQRTLPVAHLAAADALLVAAACLIPAASHLTAAPLYTLNPMLALLLLGLLLGRRAGLQLLNGLVLAVAMPLLSSLLVGMPVVEKLPCMVAELAVVAGGYALLSRRMAALPAILLAALAGKGAYYALKALLMPAATLVGTDWTVQLLALLLWGGLFALAARRTESQR